MAFHQLRLFSTALAGVLASLTLPSHSAAQTDSVRAPVSSAVLTLGALLAGVRAGSPVVEAARARVARGARVTAGALENPLLAYQIENAPFPGGRPVQSMTTERTCTATVPLAPF